MAITEEKALLGALLLDDDAWDAISGLWHAEAFESAIHREVADAVEACHAKHRRTDAVLAAAECESEPAKLACFALSRGVGTAGNVRYYAELVRDAYTGRELKRIGAEAIADEEGTVAERVARAAKAISELETGQVAKPRSMDAMTAELLVELDDQKQHPESVDKSLIPSGFRRLDHVIGGFRPGVLAIFAARPGVGKSSLAVALADNIAVRGIPVGAFWLEDEWRDFTRRILARRARIRAMLLRHGSMLDGEHFDRLVGAAESTARLPIYVDDAHGLGPEDIAARMRRMHREHGVKLFLSDHLGEIRVKSNEFEGRHDLARGHAARLYRDTGKDLGAGVILFSQMNREVERRADGIPRLSDIDGSGQVEQVARMVGFLGQGEEGSGQFWIDVQKNNTGPKSQVRLRWLEDSMTIEDVLV